MSSEYAWPTPQPIHIGASFEPYPVEALPPIIRNAVEEVHKYVKAPPSMVATSALAAVSVAAQGLYDVARDEKLRGPIGVFFIIVAKSGERKSTCDGFFTKCIRDYETQQIAIMKPHWDTYWAAEAAWESKKAGIKDKIRQLENKCQPTFKEEKALEALEKNKPTKPRTPKVLRSNVTDEALQYDLAFKWPSCSLLSSEAGNVFGGHAMAKDSAMRFFSTLDELWDGGTLSVDRRGGESFVVKGARLSIAFQVQGPTFRSFLDRTGDLARGSGLLARFLLVSPESTQGTRFFTAAPLTWPHLTDFEARVSTLLNSPVPMNADGSLSPALLSLSPEAKGAWIAFHDHIEKDLVPGGPLSELSDVASKAADNACRLAALFHVFEGRSGGTIGHESFVPASRVVAWHLNESRRYFEENDLPGETANAILLDTWLSEKCRIENTTEILASRVRQYGPNPIRGKAAMEQALKVLVDLNRVRVVREKSSQKIRINPAILRCSPGAKVATDATVDLSVSIPPGELSNISNLSKVPVCPNPVSGWKRMMADILSRNL